MLHTAVLLYSTVIHCVYGFTLPYSLHYILSTLRLYKYTSVFGVIYCGGGVLSCVAAIVEVYPGATLHQHVELLLHFLRTAEQLRSWEQPRS